MDRTQLPDAGVLEDWLEQLACHFDRAAGVAESQEALSVEELGLVEPMVGHKAPRSIGRDKETANQGRPQRSTRNVALERHRSSPGRSGIKRNFHRLVSIASAGLGRLNGA